MPGRAESIVLGLCDGMGCALSALNAINAKFNRYIAVEEDEIAKIVCNNVNDGGNDSLTADHTWEHDVFVITEQCIIDLGPGKVKLLTFGPPGQDHSKLKKNTSQGQVSPWQTRAQRTQMQGVPAGAPSVHVGLKSQSELRVLRRVHRLSRHVCRLG